MNKRGLRWLGISTLLVLAVFLWDYVATGREQRALKIRQEAFANRMAHIADGLLFNVENGSDGLFPPASFAFAGFDDAATSWRFQQSRENPGLGECPSMYWDWTAIAGSEWDELYSWVYCFDSGDKDTRNQTAIMQ